MGRRMERYQSQVRVLNRTQAPSSDDRIMQILQHDGKELALLKVPAYLPKVFLRFLDVQTDTALAS